MFKLRSTSGVLLLIVIIGFICILHLPKQSTLNKAIYNTVSVYTVVTNADGVVRRGIGSGIFISGDEILTNAHNIPPGVQHIYVTFANDGEMYEVLLLGIDRVADVAILIPMVANQFGRSGVEWAESKQYDWFNNEIFAIGTPHGIGIAVTKGIISNPTRRSATYPSILMIQVDAAANSGNSGGPLLTPDGKLAGLVNSIYTKSGGYDGITFAIHPDIIKESVQRIYTEINVERPFHSAILHDIDPTIAQAVKLHQAKGIYVQGVSADGTLGKSGLHTKDIIISVDELYYPSVFELNDYIYHRRVGEIITFSIIRDSETIFLKVLL